VVTSTFQAAAGGGAMDLFCDLSMGGDVDRMTTSVDGVNGDSVSMQVAGRAVAATKAELSCSASTAGQLNGVDMTVLRVPKATTLFQ
jgi:hypothetical protein